MLLFQNVLTYSTGKTAKNIFIILSALSLFCLIFFFLLKCLSGAQRLEIDIEIDHPDSLKVYFSNSGKFREDLSSPLLINQKRSKITVPLGNGFANYIRIDTGAQKGSAKIFQIKVLSFFNDPLLLTPMEISSQFASNSDASMQLFPDRVEVISTGNDPYIYCKKPLFNPKYWHSFIVALICSLMFLAILIPSQGASAESIPIETVQVLHNERFKALDGLRGFAALMVVADHTWGLFRGVGASGVWIFFALSGFLLARPFIDKPHLILSLPYMLQYFRRRLLRILPMYYVYLFIVFAMSGRLNLAFMHTLFLEGDGHLWAIPQEVIFYLLWPCVIFLLIFPLRSFPRLTIFLILICSIAWNRFVGIDMIWLLGMNHIKLPLFFGIFLIGVFFSFLYSSLLAYLAKTGKSTFSVNHLTSPIGLILLLFFVLFSTGQHLGNPRIVYSQMHFGLYGCLAGLLIFCVILAKGRTLDKLLTLQPLREIGLVSFSLYLLHPLVKNLVSEFFLLYFDKKLQNFSLFLATLGVSFLIAKLSYLFIERPAFQLGEPSSKSPRGILTVEPDQSAFNASKAV